MMVNRDGMCYAQSIPTAYAALRGGGLALIVKFEDIELGEKGDGKL